MRDVRTMFLSCLHQLAAALLLTAAVLPFCGLVLCGRWYARLSLAAGRIGGTCESRPGSVLP